MAVAEYLLSRTRMRNHLPKNRGKGPVIECPIFALGDWYNAHLTR